MPGAGVTQQGAGHAEERGGCSVSHGGYRGRRGGAHETPKKDMAEVAGTGRRSRAASRLRADPISHRHPASSLGQPGGAASTRPLQGSDRPSRLAGGLLPRHRHLGSVPRAAGSRGGLGGDLAPRAEGPPDVNPVLAAGHSASQRPTWVQFSQKGNCLLAQPVCNPRGRGTCWRCPAGVFCWQLLRAGPVSWQDGGG